MVKSGEKIFINFTLNSLILDIFKIFYFWFSYFLGPLKLFLWQESAKLGDLYLKNRLESGNFRFEPSKPNPCNGLMSPSNLLHF